MAHGLELILKSLGVLDDEFLILLELGSGSLLEGDGQGSDGVVVRTTLVAGEDGEVNWALEVVESLLASLRVSGTDALAEEDHGTTGTAERLVRCGGDDVSVLERRRDDTSGDETRDVSHVDNEVSANAVGDLAHASIVDQAAVSGGTSDENLRAVELSILLEHVIVDDAGLEVHAVGESLKVGRNSRDPSRY